MIHSQHGVVYPRHGRKHHYKGGSVGALEAVTVPTCVESNQRLTVWHRLRADNHLRSRAQGNPWQTKKKRESDYSSTLNRIQMDLS